MWTLKPGALLTHPLNLFRLHTRFEGPNASKHPLHCNSMYSMSGKHSSCTGMGQTDAHGCAFHLNHHVHSTAEFSTSTIWIGLTKNARGK